MALQPQIPNPNIPRKKFYHYLPLCLTVGLLLAPHPSLLIVLVNYHIRTLHAPLTFITHVLITYTLTALAFSSLIVCVCRDPGKITSDVRHDHQQHGEEEEIELTQALMSHDDGDDMSVPGRWCYTCVAPKPERTHHCRQCGRCVLKMDHHCPWLGSNCIGHRTYPAFLHFLCSITLLSTYIAVLSIFALYFAFNNPLSIDGTTPVHELFLACIGLVFALVMGSFFLYHIYLVSINQTTLENISEFILLRHLPLLPPSPTGQKLSNPPLEHELTYRQRRLVKQAHHVIRLYDVGWYKNWAQVFGWNNKWGWVYRLASGGSGQGDGRSFPRNPRTDEMLARLAIELVKVDTES